MNKKNNILVALLTVAALLCMTGFTANAAARATAITFSKTNDAKVRVGYAITRTASTSPEGLAVTYTSSDKTIATVNENGKVVGKKPGKAVITASAGGLKASYNVTIVKADDATATAISKAKEVFAGVTVTVYDAKTPATYSGGTDWPITTYYFFSADNKKLGSISGKALMTISDTAEYRASPDSSAWLADMFNEYRGLGKDSRKAVLADQIEEFRYEVIRLTNIEREKAGLPKLEIDNDAMEYAQIRAEEISVKYSHTRPNGAQKEYNGHYFLENIARRQISPDEVVKDWMNSPGHRGSILEDDVYAIGVGCYRSSNGTMHWTQEFLW